ncbi:thiopeptide-type bacteriocin biosynthesis protein [Sphaerisporangium corydalis]|uniref:Thiopeptide-type bacteriocin biosynthesis protein n=1 Tax=Sphaerisporangium corydalis TaxID=1441875 RepID=A0ABV9EHX2_9ACTN|nr:thiopeptide-type bacteriocin biosynthesis protein [Sphaerisporangium corydalis]
MRHSWHQANVTFADPRDAEHLAATRIAPILREAGHAELINSWWFIRKRQWRIRYLAAGGAAAHDVFDALTTPGPWSWTTSVYEPETHAFGGPAAMDTAHALFHADSRHILSGAHDPGDRRELTLLLFTAMMRAAGLEWFEQGDVWARAADLRPPAALPGPIRWDGFKAGTHRLLTVDTGPLRAGGSLEFAADWFAAFERAGAVLADLDRDGRLTRGLRPTIAHHMIFAWNRLGLPKQAQAAIAQASKEVVFSE